MDIKEILDTIKSTKLCLMAHPDNEEGSEFADRIDDLEGIEVKLGGLKNGILVSGCKILAVEGGMDWVDASINYMVNVSLKSGQEIYNEYTKSGGYHGNNKRWFKQWAIDIGYCREAFDDELEIVYD